MKNSVDMGRVKLLKATETLSKMWVLQYSYHWSGNKSRVPYDFECWQDFNTLDELKIWCDMNMPGIALLVETYSDWWSKSIGLKKHNEVVFAS